MPDSTIRPGSLVLYKARPALVTNVAEKIEINLEGAKSKRVRDKDIHLLHPGPVPSLSGLDAGSPELVETWELLAGEQVTLAELAELVFGDFTPATAWSAWQSVVDGLYFEGSPERIQCRSAAAVAAERADREQRAAAARAWAEFLLRVEARELDESDRKRLAEVERVAYGKAAASPILAHFGVQEHPVHAHRFLVKCGYWSDEYNPHPQRVGAATDTPDIGLPAVDLNNRHDLTHLDAYAIDDVGNQDPDDAISIEGDRLWVHVADVAALVPPDSAADLAARARGANLYLPEGIVGMLPRQATASLGLGLHAESPALSFSFRLNDDGVGDIEIVPSRVRVTRTTYRDVEQRLGEAPFQAILAMTDAFRAQRLARGASELDLPEVSTIIEDGEILIRPLQKLRSRQMVTDAMLMAGEAAARFAQQESIAIPYAVQAPPEERREPTTLSGMYAYRRLFRPSQAASHPDQHFGLGLPAYSRSTSPLRRYLDLVTHQQLRNTVNGVDALSTDVVAERIGAAAAVSGLIRKAERLSNVHWKLAWLRRHPHWQGEAVVVALDERKAVTLIPELAMETRLRRQDGMSLDAIVKIELREVDLAEQNALFRVLN